VGTPDCSLPVPEGGLIGKMREIFLTRPAETRSNGFKLQEGRYRLDARKKFFTMRVVKHWHSLPRKVLEAPSLEAFKARLDGALSSLVWLKMFLLTVGVLG